MLTGDTTVTRGDALLNKNRWEEKQTTVFAVQGSFVQLEEKKNMLLDSAYPSTLARKNIQIS